MNGEIDISTRNGGIHVGMPDNYNAQLEAQTRNGGMNVGFPVTVSGEIGKRIATRIGSGANAEDRLAPAGSPPTVR